MKRSPAVTPLQPVLRRELGTVQVCDSQARRQIVRLVLSCGHSAYRLPVRSFGHMKRCTWCLPSSERFELV